MAVPPQSPPFYPRNAYSYYYPIEGTVYDLQVMGDEVILNTSNGVLKYRVKGLSIQYLRVPSMKTRFLVFGLMVVLMMFILFTALNMFSLPLTIGFSSLSRMFIGIFILTVIVMAGVSITAYMPKPVLIIVDEAGIHHYYLIHKNNKEKIIQTATQYKPKQENIF